MKRFLGIEFTRNRQNLRFCLCVLACVDSETVCFAADFVAQEPCERKVCVHHWACPMCPNGTLCWSGGGGVVGGV